MSVRVPKDSLREQLALAADEIIRLRVELEFVKQGWERCAAMREAERNRALSARLARWWRGLWA